MSEEDKAAVRKIALDVITDYRDRGCPDPEPISAELLHEMMEWLVCEPVPDEYVPMVLEEMELDGRDARARPTLEQAARDRFPVVVIGCGESGLLAGIRLKEAGIPFTIVEKNAGVGGTWYQNTYPGRAGRRRKPLLLLQLRADRSVDALLRRAARTAGLLRARDGQARHRPARAVGNRGHRGGLGRRDRDVDRARPRPHAARRRHVCARSDQRRGATQPPAPPRRSGPRSVRRAGLPLRAMGSFGGPARQARGDDRRRRQRIPDRAGDRRPKSGTSPCFSARRSGCSRTRTTTSPSDPACSGHCGTCRSTAAGTGSCCSGRGCDKGLDAARVDPDYPDQQRAVSEINDITRMMFTEWIISQVGDDPDLLAKVVPDYPATGKRTLQDNGSWLRTLTRDNVDLVRTGIAHIEPEAVVTDDGIRYPADIIVYATGFQQQDAVANDDRRP